MRGGGRGVSIAKIYLHHIYQDLSHLQVNFWGSLERQFRLYGPYNGPVLVVVV